MLCSCSGITKTELTQEQNYKNTSFFVGVHNGERCILSRKESEYGASYQPWFTRPMLFAMTGLADDELSEKITSTDKSHCLTVALDGVETPIYDLHVFHELTKGNTDKNLIKLDQKLSQKCFSFYYNILGD